MSKIEITYQPLEGRFIEEALSLLSEKDIILLQKKARKGIVALYKEVFVGVLLYEVRGKYVIMDRVAVPTEYQRQGIGSSLLTTLGKLAEAMKYEFAFSFEGESNRDPFYRFLTSTGLFYIEKKTGFEAVLNEEDLKLLQSKYSYKPDEGGYFFDLSKKAQDEFLLQVEKGYPEIADEIRNWESENYKKELCCCTVSKGQVQAACFIRDFETEMELRLLYALPNRGVLAAKALFQSVSNLDPEYMVPVYLTPTGEATAKIIEGLCPSYEIRKNIYMVYYMGKSEARRGTV